MRRSAASGGGVCCTYLEGVGPAARLVVQHLQDVPSTLLGGTQLLGAWTEVRGQVVLLISLEKLSPFSLKKLNFHISL